MIIALALLGPSLDLEIQKCSKDYDPLNVQLAFFSALDVLEDEMFAESSECYHGRIAPAVGVEGSSAILSVYGYSTPTNVKLLLLVDNKEVGERHIQEVFKDIQKAYVDAVCNPFLRYIRDSTRLNQAIDNALDKKKRHT